ncbi:hypothetical protein CASFOL_042016 [Castilleja foliolosa]|uniref:SKP1-like protein n=1 Tax=Castilleja foliolosa TaxID=1961234 RepID=A0ABD3B9K0_9LAMI
MVILKTSDDKLIEVEDSIIIEAQTIKNMIEDGYADNVIPIPKVKSEVLAKVIEYCRHHAAARPSDEGDETVDKKAVEDELDKYDKKFVKIDQEMIFEIILAANYLNIKSLIDLMCDAVANKMVYLSMEEVRKMFGQVNDLSPEEEEAIRTETAWAYE